MLEVKIFRFNAKKDVLAYHKPYFFENFSFENLENLLAFVKQNDPYFDYSGVNFVKINGVVTDISTDFQAILRRFGKLLTIDPLSKRRARKDLAIDDGDFWAKFEPFARICTGDDRKIYEDAKPYFYADFVRKYEPNFIGLSAIVLAQHLAQKYPQKMPEILNLVADLKFGVFIAQDISKRLFDGSEKVNEAISWLRSNLQTPAVKIPVLSEQEPLAKLNLKHDFSGFKIALYDKIAPEFTAIKAKFINLPNAHLPCGFELLGLNRELALKFASDIVFEAFDSGADFLVVNNEQAFYMFDTLSSECQKVANREISGFYVLRASELIALANGEKPQSLQGHKLKVLI